MTASDLKPGIKVQLQNGTTFAIESISNGTVTSSLVNGSRGNYRTEINDAVEFFNENNAKIISL